MFVDAIMHYIIAFEVINNYKLSINTMLECKNVYKQHEYEVLVPYKF